MWFSASVKLENDAVNFRKYQNDVMETKEIHEVLLSLFIFIVNGVYFMWVTDRVDQRNVCGFWILPFLCRDAWLATNISQKFGQELPSEEPGFFFMKKTKQTNQKKKVNVKVCPNFWRVPKLFPPEIPDIRLMACKSATLHHSHPPLALL